MPNKDLDLSYWINEREAMRLRKEGPDKIPRPWTGDPNMARVRWCNIRREDDKVTRWIAKNWRDPNAKDLNLTLAMVMARMINWPDTLEIIGYPYTGNNELTLEARKHAMKQIVGKKWTPAYTISTCGRAMGKEDYVFDHVLRQVADVDWNSLWMLDRTHNLANAHKDLTKIDGLGSFLAAQVLADLKNTPGHPLQKADDWWTWSAPGPGSLRGLAAYYGAPVTPSNYARAIDNCWLEIKPLLADYVPELHMQDFQNCLCEFSKYMRVKEGDGRVRNKYTAG